MKATQEMKHTPADESFNFWCKVCGGVVYGKRTNHAHNVAPQAKHTPGPWRIVDRGQQMTPQISGPGVLCPIARLVDFGQGKSAEMDANAALIAAAPRLLAAAKAVLPLNEMFKAGTEWAEEFDELEAAIQATEKGGAA